MVYFKFILIIAFCFSKPNPTVGQGPIRFGDVKPDSLFQNEPPRSEKFIPYGIQIQENGVMKCNTKNLDSFKLVWLKNMVPLPQDPRIQVTEEVLQSDPTRKVSYLRIQDSKYEDSGLYYCFLYNTTTNELITGLYFRVTVYEPETTYTERNTPIHLHCTGERNFYEHKVWTKDGKPLPDDPRYVQSEISPNPIRGDKIRAISLVAIFNPQIKDSGVYACGKRDGVVKYPLLVQEPKTVIKKLNKSEVASFKCSFTTSFNPIIEWKKNGLPIIQNSRHLISQRKTKESTITPIDLRPEIKVSTTVTTLDIIDVKGSDSGNYSCAISNSPDYPYWRDMVLTVEDDSEAFPTKPSFSSNKVVSLSAGEVAIFQCTADDLEFAPEFIWKKDGAEVDMSDYRFSVRSFELPQIQPAGLERSLSFTKKDYESIMTLIYTRSDDAGQYTCHVVKSGIDYQTKSFTLIVNH